LNFFDFTDVIAIKTWEQRLKIVEKNGREKYLLNPLEGVSKIVAILFYNFLKG
jgi:hypothetical protein